MDKRTVLETIIRAAMANEEKGSRFYATVAGSAPNQKIKAIFEKLSREELEHKEAFEKILRSEMAGEEGEMEESEGRLLISLIKTGIFHGLKAEGDWDSSSPVKALALGIQAEKDSILLYQGIYNQSGSQAVRNMMSRLLEEEKMHLVELREEMENLEDEGIK